MEVAREVKAYTCICCPMGCWLEVDLDETGAVLEVSGYRCARGRDYAKTEAADPRRMVTSYVLVFGCIEPLSVKTASPVPKHLVPDVLEAIKAIRVRLPVQAGDTVLEDVCATGVAVVATKSLGCR